MHVSTYGELDTSPVAFPQWQAVKDFNGGTWVSLAVAGLSVAFVAALETLISAKIAQLRVVKLLRARQNSDQGPQLKCKPLHEGKETRALVP